jgi:hypothetical protein
MVGEFGEPRKSQSPEHFSYLLGIEWYYNEKIKNLQISSYSYIMQN